MQAVSCSYADLGNLTPTVFGKYTEVDGVSLPDNVLDELRRLGLPLSFFNRGELEDAVIACAVDSELADDENGINFRDKLTLTRRESLLQKSSRNKIFLSSGDDDEAPGYFC